MASSGPHHRTMGNAQSRQVLTDVRSDCGQLSTGPSGVFDQSSARMRRAISLLPGKISSIIEPAPTERIEERFDRPARLFELESRAAQSVLGREVYRSQS